MRFIDVLSFAALSTALVIPDEQVMSEIAIESHRKAESFAEKGSNKISELVNVVDRTLEKTFDDAKHDSKHIVDEAFGYADEAYAHATEAGKHAYTKVHDTAFDAESWISDTIETRMKDIDLDSILGGGDEPPHHGNPHGPHHGPLPPSPPVNEPNMTLYQLITSNKYTTKLAKLIKDDEDLVKILNGTAANYTVFAPTDRAFEKIPDHDHEPSKELIKKVLLYHVSPDYYPAKRILVSHTIPTLLKESHLGKDSPPQRLSTNIGFRGLTVNFYARVVAIDIVSHS